MSTIVSIIVPVYNSEKYLRQCLDSIRCQTFKNIEVILVNDGSEDSSGKICRDAAVKDSRFRVINQKNSGVSIARNVGILDAKGDFITFVDSDDFIASNMIERLLNTALCQKNELVLVSCNLACMSDTKDNKSGTSRKMTRKEAVSNMLYMKDIINAPYAKLIPADIARSLKFDKNLYIGEDLDYNYRLLQKINQVIHVDADLYYYRQNPDGAMAKPFSRKRMTGLNATAKILRHAKELSDKKILNAARFRHFMEALFILQSLWLVRNKSKNRKNINLIKYTVRKYAHAAALSEASRRHRLLALLCCVSPSAAVYILELRKNLQRHGKI